jgi:hypothetical protein
VELKLLEFERASTRAFAPSSLKVPFLSKKMLATIPSAFNSQSSALAWGVMAKPVTVSRSNIDGSLELTPPEPVVLVSKSFSWSMRLVVGGVTGTGTGVGAGAGAKVSAVALS